MDRYMPLLMLIACSSGVKANDPPTPGTGTPSVTTGLPGTGTTTPTDPRYRGLPDGMLAFVDDDACPLGWTEWEPGVGRAIVAVSAGADVARHAGEALTTADPHPHDHAISATLDIPGAGISGLSSCCNGSPGASGSYPVSGAVDAAEAGIPTLALTVCRLDQASDGDLGHSLPAGMAAFFDRATCPDGMVRLANSSGYMVLPTTDRAAVGQTVGTPLEPGEDRTHTHATTLGVTVPVASLAASGGSNNDTARAGLTEVVVDTEPAASGLPTVDALLCEARQEVPTEGGPDVELTGGAIIWSTGDCPTGWLEHLPLEGRLAVGRPDGVFAGTPSGDPLDPLTLPSHDHTGGFQVSVGGRDVALVSGCCFDTNGGNGTFDVAVSTSNEALDLPFLHLRACYRPVGL